MKLGNQMLMLSTFSVCSLNQKEDETGAGYWVYPESAKRVWAGAPTTAPAHQRQHRSIAWISANRLRARKIPGPRGPSAAAALDWESC